MTMIVAVVDYATILLASPLDGDSVLTTEVFFALWKLDTEIRTAVVSRKTVVSRIKLWRFGLQS